MRITIPPVSRSWAPRRRGDTSGPGRRPVQEKQVQAKRRHGRQCSRLQLRGERVQIGSNSSRYSEV